MGTPDTDILVIDGDAQTAALLCDLFSDEGYGVRAVHNCAAAVMTAQARMPNLIVLDLGRRICCTTA